MLHCEPRQCLIHMNPGMPHPDLGFGFNMRYWGLSLSKSPGWAAGGTDPLGFGNTWEPPPGDSPAGFWVSVAVQGVSGQRQRLSRSPARVPSTPRTQHGELRLLSFPSPLFSKHSRRSYRHARRQFLHLLRELGFSNPGMFDPLVSSGDPVLPAVARRFSCQQRGRDAPLPTGCSWRCQVLSVVRSSCPIAVPRSDPERCPCPPAALQDRGHAHPLCLGGSRGFLGPNADSEALSETQNTHKKKASPFSPSCCSLRALPSSSPGGI